MFATQAFFNPGFFELQLPAQPLSTNDVLRVRTEFVSLGNPSIGWALSAYTGALDSPDATPFVTLDRFSPPQQQQRPPTQWQYSLRTAHLNVTAGKTSE